MASKRKITNITPQANRILAQPLDILFPELAPQPKEDTGISHTYTTREKGRYCSIYKKVKGQRNPQVAKMAMPKEHKWLGLGT